MCFLQHVLITALQTVSQDPWCSGGYPHNARAGAVGLYSRVIWLAFRFSALVTQICPWIQTWVCRSVSAGLPGSAPWTDSRFESSGLRAMQRLEWLLSSRAALIPFFPLDCGELRQRSCHVWIPVLGSEYPKLCCCSGSCFFPAGGLHDPGMTSAK